MTFTDKTANIAKYTTLLNVLLNIYLEENVM